MAEGTLSNSDIPDGEYVTVVEEVALTHSSIVWTFRIRGGSDSDRLLRKVRPVTERTIAWVKEDFIKCSLKLVLNRTNTFLYQNVWPMPRHAPAAGRGRMESQRTGQTSSQA